MILCIVWCNRQMEQTKQCTGVCGLTKSFSEFSKRTDSKDGHCSQCKKCKKTYDKARYDADPTCAKENNKAFYLANPDYNRNHHLLYFYGLTLESLTLQLSGSGGLCAIPSCSALATDVDHDHNHGCYPEDPRRSCGLCIRGITCADCNKGLGCFQDSTLLLVMAAQYLGNNLAWPIDRARKITIKRSADDYSRRNDLRHLYRITLEERIWILNLQSGACAVCLRPESEAGTLHVDHCHSTDTIRGLLCGRCNTGLERFQDNPDKILSGIEYLSNPPSTLASENRFDILAC